MAHSSSPYAQALDAPVFIAVDVRALKAFSFIPSLEEQILAEYHKRHPEKAPSALDSHNTAASPPHPVLQPSKVSPKLKLKEDLQELAEVLQASKISSNSPKPVKSLIDQGQVAADKYIPHETSDKKSVLCRLVNHAVKLNASESDALQAFFLYDGDETKGQTYLDNIATLRDLGFHAEKVEQALVKNDNDQEKALEYLMQIND